MDKGIYIHAKYRNEFIALSKLIILRDIYRESEDEKVDWLNDKQLKIYLFVDSIEKKVEISSAYQQTRPLSFTDINIAKLFLKNFESLIIEAKELL